MTLHNITETFVEKAKLPAEGEVFYRDRTLRGFALRWPAIFRWLKMQKL